MPIPEESEPARPAFGIDYLMGRASADAADTDLAGPFADGFDPGADRLDAEAWQPEAGVAAPPNGDGHRLAPHHHAAETAGDRSGGDSPEPPHGESRPDRLAAQPEPGTHPASPTDRGWPEPHPAAAADTSSTAATPPAGTATPEITAQPAGPAESPPASSPAALAAAVHQPPAPMALLEPPGGRAKPAAAYQANAAGDAGSPLTAGGIDLAVPWPPGMSDALELVPSSAVMTHAAPPAASPVATPAPPPVDWRLLLEAAEQAEKREDWPEAERLWREMRNVVPHIWYSYTGGAVALAGRGRHEDAKQLLSDAAVRFPDEPGIAHAQGRLAMSLGDWPAAEAHWRHALALGNQPWWIYTELAGALEHQGRLIDAENVLFQGQAHAADPNEITLYTYPARLAWMRQDWAAAVARWTEARRRFPQAEELPARQYEALMRLAENDLAAYDAALRAMRAPALESAPTPSSDAWRTSAPGGTSASSANGASTPIPGHNPAPIPSHGPATVPGGSFAAIPGHGPAPVPSDSFAAIPGGPSTSASGTPPTPSPGANFIPSPGILAAPSPDNLATPGAKSTPSSDTLSTPSSGSHSTPSSGDDSLALVLRFESLGGTGPEGGCEFGCFQRQYGAEPLGLFRWATVSPASLIACLRGRFEGLGDTGTVTISPHDGQWEIRDTIYGTSMHSFVSCTDVPHDRMLDMASRRMRYLREKLIADLEHSSKIFVLKSGWIHVTQAETMELSQALRNYGPNELLCVCSANPERSDNRIVSAAPGVFVGYIDFSGNRPGTAHRYPAWDALCRTMSARSERSLLN